MNETAIISAAKEFVAVLREEIHMVGDDNLFTIAIGGVRDLRVSISKYDDMKVGTLSNEKFPKLYKESKKFLSKVKELCSGVSGVFILLTDEHETEVTQNGRLLRIFNLDA